MSKPFLIFGHRGSPRRFPENTRASFEEALRAGADGFETDLRLLSDKVAVLYHDDEMDADEIESLSSAQILQRGHAVSRVRELDAFAGRCTMVLEVKRSRWEELLIEAVAGWPDIVVASFDHGTIRWLAERRVPFALGVTTFGYIIDLADYVSRIGAGWCFPNFRFVEEELVRSLHERGIKVVPWTVNRETDWSRLQDIGCDGVITDLPEEAVVWRSRNEKLKIEN
jgi:glycerophosphoryl diester phosphodiesterase